MDRNTALLWSWLNVLTKKRADALCQVYGDMTSALAALNEDVLKGLGCRDETIYRVLNRLDEFDPEAYEKELARRSIQFLHMEDEEYPAKLKELPDPPVFLYYMGDLSVLNQPCIGVVGTREMSPYGKRVTESIVPSLVQAGMVTVSGLAKGIDEACAQESIDADGPTVAVLGHGFAELGPSRFRIAKEIVDAGGLVLTEYPLDGIADKFTFPARNRIIAGLSLGTVVLEAPEGSGALITADLALDYGREVFAVPGQIFDENYVGCHQLLAKGHAKLVQSADDILSEFHISAPSQETSQFEPTSPMEQKLFEVLTTMPQSVTEITERADVEVGEANATLTMMELAGAAKNVGAGMWVRQ